MEKDILWKDFEQSGKVEDYLKYKKEILNEGVKNEVINEVNQG